MPASDPSQILRSLRRGLALLGVDTGDVPDTSTVDDLEAVLVEALEGVDRLRPVAHQRPPAERYESLYADQIRRLAEEGLSDPQIAERLRLRSTEAVRSVRRRSGIEAAVAPGPPTAGQKALRLARLRELYDSGAGRAAMAEELGLTEASVSTYLTELGLRLRDRRKCPR